MTLSVTFILGFSCEPQLVLLCDKEISIGILGCGKCIQNSRFAKDSLVGLNLKFCANNPST